MCGAVDYLFYQTPWVMLLVVPVSVFFLKWKKKQMIRERKRRLNYQFRDALNSMSVAVQAGYSVENAVKESLKEMQVFYSDDAAILRELEIMVRQDPGTGTGGTGSRRTVRENKASRCGKLCRSLCHGQEKRRKSDVYYPQYSGSDWRQN